jgi:hypothetical protein
MSNALAVAAVTVTMQAILGNGVTADPDLTDTTVTVLPLDKARGSNTANQLNLFLYQILPDAAWRNMNIPSQVGPLESGTPPLALSMYYLLTAFGRDNDTTAPFGHHLLGQAMSVLYDHALLGPDEIRAATAVPLPASNLDKQIERLRITLQPLSLEEISKLWTGLATQYRLSVAYEVSVALIDSSQSKRAPLPVLTRGPSDQGILSQSNLIPPFPSLDQVRLSNNQPSALLGDTLLLIGHNLDGTSLGVQFNHPLWTSPVEVAPLAGGTSTQVSVQVPNVPGNWPAGFYSVAVLVQRPGETYRRTTNLLSFALAPMIVIAPASAAGPNITYTVTCVPDVRPEQEATLLISDQEVAAQPHPTQTNTLTFNAQNLTAGPYFVRLRVDGVDTLLVKRNVAPPIFDATQQVTVT